MSYQDTKFIVCSTYFGPLYGTITSRTGRIIHMADARSMVDWLPRDRERGCRSYGEYYHHLLDCANTGINPEECEFSRARGHITVMDAAVYMPISEEAQKTFDLALKEKL